MNSRLIIDGNAVYEIDEECMKKKQGKSHVDQEAQRQYPPGKGAQRDKEKR